MKRQILKLFFAGLSALIAGIPAVFGADGEASASKIRVFLIGDSTCATKKLDKQNPERGWGQLFQPLFDETVVIENHAVNGRSTKSFRDLGHWAVVEERLQGGDYVFIQFGHNDAKESDSLRYASPAQYADNLRRYISEIRAKGGIPVILTPIMRRNFKSGVLTDTHGDYPAMARMVAGEQNTPLIDMHKVTFDWLTELGDEASVQYFMHIAPGTNPLHHEGLTDNTHLNVRGAHVMSRLVASQLAEAVPVLAEHLDIPDLVVAKDGSGDFFTVGEAVAAIPDFCRRPTVVEVCGGVYREKISIPYTKNNVVMKGRGDVVVSWDDYADKIGATGAAMGTSGSSTVYFGGSSWTVENITFENTAGCVGQAVAVQCLGTDLNFRRCRFLGNQDTLYLYGLGNRDGETVADNGICRFDECYIEGTCDFIFGAASAVFRNCEIHSKADSYVTAASTCKGLKAGFIFIDCRLTAADEVKACYLGRPWREYAQTVFIRCELGGHIRPEGWHDWNKPAAHKTAFYGEYGSFGAGAAGERVRWSHKLSVKDAVRIETLADAL